MAEGEKSGGLSAIPVEEVADLLGVTSKTVRNWLNKEDLPSTNDGRRRVLDWPTTLEWYVQRRIREGGNAGSAAAEDLPEGEESFDEALRRKTSAEADLKELKLAELRGQLVPAVDVGRSVGQVAQAIKTKLDSLPSALALRLVGKSDRAEVQQILQDAIYRVELELAEVGRKSEPRKPIPDDDEDA